MKELIILPPLKALSGPHGGYILTRKYMEGVAEFSRTWPGPVTSLVEITGERSTDMDHEEFSGDDPNTPIEQRPANLPDLSSRLQKASVVFTFLSSTEEHLVELCGRIGVPLVFWVEYSPQTEAQILQAEKRNLLRRWRGMRWLARATAIRKAMVASAAGLQCSGRPVYDFYGHHSPNPIIFWDSRVRANEVMTDAELDTRASLLAKGAPLRLGFGGRLIEMKGVQFLPQYAAALRQLDIPFTFDVYGSGPLQGALESQIARLGLADVMTLRGALDFRTEWLPTLKQNMDLFICPHPQGDPSSTYPEAMSCGLPILGFANEALATIAQAAQSGWTVPIGDVDALAAKTAELHNDRGQLVAHARRGRDFAQDHCFEQTKMRRAEHLIDVAGVGR